MAEKFLCPHCHERSVVKEKKRYDENFQLVGVDYVCAFCGAKVESSAPETAKSGRGSAKLAALLGEAVPEKPKFETLPDDGRFCLHCRNFLKHPFKNVCKLTMKEIQAMDTCPDFRKCSE